MEFIYDYKILMQRNPSTISTGHTDPSRMNEMPEETEENQRDDSIAKICIVVVSNFSL